MKKLIAILAAMLMVFAFSACSDDDDGGSTGSTGSTGSSGSLFFSEYTEGSSNNKYLEIYNPGTVAVDLSAYTVLYFGNGATEASITNWITNGTTDSLAAGGVVVLANDSATIFTGTIQQSYAYPSALAFNGNDALALAKDGVIVDQLGTVGSSDYFGDNRTLVRLSTITSGNTTYTVSEWTEKGSDYVDTLGSWGDPAAATSEGNYNASDWTTTALTLDGGIQAIRTAGEATGLTTTITGIICAVEDSDEFWIQDKDAGIFCYGITLQSAPAFGDQVTFEVTTVGSYNGLLQITGITASSDSVQSSGNTPYVVDMTDSSSALTTAIEGTLVRYTGSIASSGQFTGIGAFYNANSTPGDFSTGRTGVWVGPIGQFSGTAQLMIMSTNYFLMN